ncbi:MAG: TetR/AcrR family transcriptional regulator [Vicinamibacterales bacterium]
MPSSSTPRRRRPFSRDSRADVFTAAAELFSARGFDGVGIDDIAHAARLNKAMIYYHFDSKRALYTEVVQDMLRAVGSLAIEAAARLDAADIRLASFIAGLIQMADERPWFPPLMLREIAEGAPRLEPDTLALMKSVFVAFGRILADGQASGLFRPVNPVLAYMSILGPILLNAARERAAARPGRIELPMFAEVSHAELTAHMQQAALRLLSAQEPRP